MSKIKHLFIFKLNLILRLVKYNFDALFLYLILGLITYFVNFKNEFYYVLFIIIPGLYYSYSRKDEKFLKKLFNVIYCQVIFSLELLFISIVPTIILFFKGVDFKIILLGVVFNIICSFIKIKGKKYDSNQSYECNHHHKWNKLFRI